MSFKLYCFAVILCGIIIIRYTTLDYEAIRYNDYLRKFNKSYSENEFRRRIKYFEVSLKEIEILNNGDTRTGAEHGLTKFSDWSKQEFNKMFGKLSTDTYCVNVVQPICPIPLFTPTVRQIRQIFGIQINFTKLWMSCKTDLKKSSITELPAKLDWRKNSVIGPVTNQKMCNGCWAFGIVGIMEAMAAIIGLGYDKLSVQQLLDCSKSCNGCYGGNTDNALLAMCYNGYSLTTEAQYPLKLVNNICRKDMKNGVRRIKSYEVHCDVDDDFIMQHLVNGPVMTVVHPTGWKNYNSGIITRYCFDDLLEMVHVVQIVGYDTTTNEIGEEIPYYIVKNSWGSDWGENGYIRIARGKNLCGVNDHIVFLDVA